MTSDEPLVERISLFMLRKRQFPGLAHEAFVVGKYYLIDKIDEGAMGIVCKHLRSLLRKHGLVPALADEE